MATSGFLTALECAKFVFGRGSDPEPAGGAYSAPPDRPLAGLTGTCFWEGREGGRGREGGEGKERGGEGVGRERERGEGTPPLRKFLIRPWTGLLK